MKAKYWHNNQKKDIDLIGLGNAIVDIIVNVEDKFLEVNNLKKGSMSLIINNIQLHNNFLDIYSKFVTSFRVSISALSSLTASISRGTNFSYLTVK